MKRFVVLAALAFLLPSEAPAILFWNLGNGDNLTDPGTGAPFASVGRVTNVGNTIGVGSAVYLGGGFILTANHVLINATYNRITFNGTDSFEVDTSFASVGRYAGKKVAPNVDLAVVKLLTSPSVAPVPLLTSPSELVAASTIVGWGVGRNPSVPLGNVTVAWGNATTEAKRWGENVPRGLAVIPHGSGNFTAITTVLGGGEDFDPTGLGANEAAVTVNDSGAGLFQNISGTWYLIGVATNVQAFGNSTFGNDTTSTPRGHYNYFARISEYDHLITGLVPEPSPLALSALAAAASLLSLRRRHPRGPTAGKTGGFPFPR
jgi:hypothetical protein